MARCSSPLPPFTPITLVDHLPVTNTTQVAPPPPYHTPTHAHTAPEHVVVLHLAPAPLDVRRAQAPQVALHRLGAPNPHQAHHRRAGEAAQRDRLAQARLDAHVCRVRVLGFRVKCG